jgi:hypothetical protein
LFVRFSTRSHNATQTSTTGLSGRVLEKSAASQPAEVNWDTLLPRREYCLDSASATRNAREECGLLTQDEGDSVEFDFERDGNAADASLKAQLRKMIEDPSRLSQHVGVAKIINENNPAWHSKEKPGYFAFAKRNFAPGTVLGFYGGMTSTAAEVELHYSDYTFDLTEHLVIDARYKCNELAFVNDYRSDVVNYDKPSEQARPPNCEAFNFWKLDEDKPRIAYLCLTNIGVGEEILIDYGKTYWQEQVMQEEFAKNQMQKALKRVKDLNARLTKKQNHVGTLETALRRERGGRKELASMSDSDLRELTSRCLQTFKRTQKEIDERRICSICCGEEKDCVLNCGHTFCDLCANQMDACPICRVVTDSRIRLHK